jgi:hypothetical protein
MSVLLCCMASACPVTYFKCESHFLHLLICVFQTSHIVCWYIYIYVPWISTHLWFSKLKFHVLNQVPRYEDTSFAQMGTAPYRRMGSWGIAPHILSLATRRRSVDSFAARLLYPPLSIGLEACGPHSRSGRCGDCSNGLMALPMW